MLQKRHLDDFCEFFLLMSYTLARIQTGGLGVECTTQETTGLDSLVQDFQQGKTSLQILKALSKKVHFPVSLIMSISAHFSAHKTDSCTQCLLLYLYVYDSISMLAPRLCYRSYFRCS